MAVAGLRSKIFFGTGEEVIHRIKSEGEKKDRKWFVD
jgi:hypothetical protein